MVISSRVIWRQFWGRKRGEVDKNNHSGRHYLLANTITIIIIVVVITITIINIITTILFIIWRWTRTRTQEDITSWRAPQQGKIEAGVGRWGNWQSLLLRNSVSIGRYLK